MIFSPPIYILKKLEKIKIKNKNTFYTHALSSGFVDNFIRSVNYFLKKIRKKIIKKI